MSDLSLENFGTLVANKRGSLGVRAAARNIGISPSTLCRVESGQLPDLENFGKICHWLQVEPSSILGFEADDTNQSVATVHFRKKSTMELETAEALAQMILAAQRMMMARSRQ